MQCMSVENYMALDRKVPLLGLALVVAVIWVRDDGLHLQQDKTRNRNKS